MAVVVGKGGYQWEIMEYLYMFLASLLLAEIDEAFSRRTFTIVWRASFCFSWFVVVGGFGFRQQTLPLDKQSQRQVREPHEKLFIMSTAKYVEYSRIESYKLHTSLLSDFDRETTIGQDCQVTMERVWIIWGLSRKVLQRNATQCNAKQCARS